ncbi:MAG: AMP-binding protein [Beijerinckiaceae bacterium]
MATAATGKHLWLASYPAGVPATIDPTSAGTIADILAASARKFANRPAFESFGKKLTYAEIEKASLAVTCWLQDQGLQKGDRVAIMMPNVMAYPAVMFGIIRGGFTVVNVNPLYTSRELEHQLNDSGAKIIFVLENFAHVLETAKPGLKTLQKIVLATAGDLLGFKGTIVNFVSRKVKKVVKAFSLPGAETFKSVLSAGSGKTPKAVTITPEDVAFLQYTGGTTGVSKGATLLHRNITANVIQADAWITPFLDTTKSDPVMVTALPLYHIFALTCCCIYMQRLGACCLLIANPRDIPGFIKTLQTTPFTMMSGVNTLYNALLNAPGCEKIDFSKLQFAVAGGTAMQGPVAKRWKERTGKPIIEGYGLSETSPIATVNPLTLQEFSGTIGMPIPSTEVKIVDLDGKDVGLNGPGEIWIRGPQVMAGYWQRPEETAKAMTSDGWFKSGDVGVMLPDGQFKIVDRMKDMVLVSGFNVYPNEVEEVISAHPGVLEVAVIGLPDDHSGEAVAAYVIKKDETVTEEQIKAHCRESLTAYKCPRTIVFRTELPKTNVGKVLRRVLRDEVMGKTAS